MSDVFLALLEMYGVFDEVFYEAGGVRVRIQNEVGHLAIIMGRLIYILAEENFRSFGEAFEYYVIFLW